MFTTPVSLYTPSILLIWELKMKMVLAKKHPQIIEINIARYSFLWIIILPIQISFSEVFILIRKNHPPSTGN